jgi:hypothetical protein
MFPFVQGGYPGRLYEKTRQSIDGCLAGVFTLLFYDVSSFVDNLVPNSCQIMNRKAVMVEATLYIIL